MHDIFFKTITTESATSIGFSNYWYKRKLLVVLLLADFQALC